MIGLAANLVLAFIWALLWGEVTLGRLVIGFALGYLLLIYAERLTGRRTYTLKAPRILSFGLYFLRELVRANLWVAYDVLHPKRLATPAVLAIPLEARTDLEITLLASLISLTPGTLTLDVAVTPERRTLYVHAMFAGDPETLRREIKDGLERRLLEILR